MGMSTSLSFIKLITVFNTTILRYTISDSNSGWRDPAEFGRGIINGLSLGKRQSACSGLHVNHHAYGRLQGLASGLGDRLSGNTFTQNTTETVLFNARSSEQFHAKKRS